MGFYQPGRAQVHVDRPLTDLSIAFLQNASNFVAARVFPNVPVAKQSDAYYTIPRGYFNRNGMAKRPPGTRSVGGAFAVANSTYFADVWAEHWDLPAQVADNADSELDLETTGVEFLTHQALIAREVDWVDQYFTAAAAFANRPWTYQADGAVSGTAAASIDFTADANNQLVYWNSASSTPIENVRLMKRTILASTGFMPNVLTLGREVYDTLVDHPDIVGRLDRGQTEGPVVATRANLAALFEVEEILVSDAIQNTGVEGGADDHSFIAGKNALLTYRPASPGLLRPSAGYTFSWTGSVTGNEFGIEIDSWFDRDTKTTRIEAEMAFSQHKIAPELGGFFNGIVE